ncbi:ribonuclease H-like domain-containing protein [Xylaria sp. FL1042]|nr:ribonuclease H-like domain-containing protein [Xylaria sp. FL1042]
MVYRMEFYTDGGCRDNGRPWAIGVAVCLSMTRLRTYNTMSRELPPDPRPTKNRAEITAIMMALEWTLEKYGELDGRPTLSVRIYSDSQYAIGCMDSWLNGWRQNEWRNSAGNEIVNRDLIEQAADLDDQVRRVGSVDYIWIPRSENRVAARICNEKLEEMDII